MGKRQSVQDAASAVVSVVYPIMGCIALSAILAGAPDYSFTCVHDEQDERAALRHYRPWKLDGLLTKQPESAEQRAERYRLAHEQLQRQVAVVFVGSFLVFIVFFTFCVAMAYKMRFGRAIKAWMGGSILLVLGYNGGSYLRVLLVSRCVPVDWITFVLLVWNLTLTGWLAIFWKAPRWFNQLYLVLVAALMSTIFRAVGTLATWLLLCGLVVWDLFAVLSPYGPLKWLVDIAAERNESLPALVYDTDPSDAGRETIRSGSNRVQDIRDARPTSTSTRRRTSIRSHADDGYQTLPMTDTDDECSEVSTDPGDSDEEDTKPPTSSSLPASSQIPSSSSSSLVAVVSGQIEGRADLQVKHHLKLGLGDFVFYSVLTGTSLRSGGQLEFWVTAVAIVFGLLCTLFLLLVFQKPLPALPISLTFGMIFYIMAALSLRPFVLHLFETGLFT
ncbi:Presenilin-like protein [Porphyridium purpureum]|uniref:Presenilin-like protein n=1 Tax=Porphyridium purpureum TaxID=35688 RepID=A0A5J4YZU4_PORPP|nr:Presenilin-like protein [Porphyridium purpureum]|eukprot:POR6949..scf208_2